MNKSLEVITLKSRDILEVIYDTISKCVRNIILPVGSTLVPSTLLCLGITIVTLLCKIFNIYTFLDYRGTLLALFILSIQCYCERRSNNDILRIYNTAQLHFKEIERREARPGSYVGNTRNKAGDVCSNDEDRGRANSGVQDSVRRLTGSAVDSSSFEGYAESDR